MIAATKDEVAQKKGVVAIGYNVNSGNIFQTKALKDIVMNMAYIRDGIPLKWSVYHFLYDWNNPALKFAISCFSDLSICFAAVKEFSWKGKLFWERKPLKLSDLFTYFIFHSIHSGISPANV